MSIEGEPIKCSNCRGACCRAFTSMPLTDTDAERMREAGTEMRPLIPDTLFGMVELTIDDEGQPIQKHSQVVIDELDWEAQAALFAETSKGLADTDENLSMVFLAAAYYATTHRREYLLKSDCGFLDQETFECRNYEDRPQVCRDFQEASPECFIMRERADVPPVPVEVTFRANKPE